MLGNFRFCLGKEGNKIAKVEISLTKAFSDYSHLLYHSIFTDFRGMIMLASSKTSQGYLSNDSFALFLVFP
jgi:hypothetical protein